MPRKGYVEKRLADKKLADKLEGFNAALVGCGGVFVAGVGLVSGLDGKSGLFAANKSLDVVRVVKVANPAGRLLSYGKSLKHYGLRPPPTEKP